MKSSLKFLALASAAAVPAATAAEFAGVSLPTALDPLSMLGSFVIAFVLLIATGDYSRRAGARRLTAELTTATEKAAHPLAA